MKPQQIKTFVKLVIYCTITITLDDMDMVTLQLCNIDALA